MAKQIKTSQPEPTAELAVVETLPTEIAEMVQKSGLIITEAQSIAIQFAPFMQVVNEHAQIIAGIEKENPTETDAKLARQHRLKLVENRGTKGLATLHTGLKENILVRGRYIDSLKNAVENASKLSELEADAIEKHQERLEAKRKAELFDTRKSQLEPFGTDTTYLPLGEINEDQFARILENEQLAFNARKEAAEKLELARIEAERIEAERQAELARLQAERIEAERLEAIRVKEELARLEAEKVAELAAKKERAEQYVNILISNGFTEHSGGEAWSKGGSWSIKWEKLLYFTDADFEDEVKRVNDWNNDRIAMEIEEKRRAKELENERQQRAAEAEKLAKENEVKLAEQKRLAEIESKKQADILAKQKAEAEKLAKELQAKKDAETKELESKRLAQLAPDKEKINAMYLLLRDLELPAFTSPECQQLATEVKNRISHILSYIKEESKKLS